MSTSLCTFFCPQCSTLIRRQHTQEKNRYLAQNSRTLIRKGKSKTNSSHLQHMRSTLYSHFFNRFCTGGVFFPNPLMLHRLFFFASTCLRTTSGGGMAPSVGLAGSPSLVPAAVCVGVVSGTTTDCRPACVKYVLVRGCLAVDVEVVVSLDVGRGVELRRSSAPEADSGGVLSVGRC